MLHMVRTRALLVLAAFAAGTMATLLPGGSAGAANLCVVGNGNAVVNGPTAPTVCTFATPVTITEIRTYHWNKKHGAVPGTVGLKGVAIGTMTFAATGTPGQDGTPNANWVADTQVTVPAGTYTIVDSDSATWSQNAATMGRGFVNVVGTAAPGPHSTPTPVPLSHFKCYTIVGPAPPSVVLLSDQFRQAVRTILGPAELLCTPVVKTVVIGKRVKDPPGADHLTCYQIKPTPSPSAQPQITNQFETGRPVNVMNARLLCVPTVKKMMNQG
jgi:hypothetical protein